MKNILPAFVLGLLCVPFFFNSCQSGFQAQHSLNSSLSPHACKVAMEKGQAQKLIHSYLETPKPFSASKLVLNDPNSPQTLQKVGSDEHLPQGSSLSAIYNNHCLMEAETSDVAKLWDLISPDGSVEPLPELFNQAYSIELDRDYDVSELEELIEADTCVVGVSWNETYGASSVSFNDYEIYQQGHLQSIRALEAYNRAYGSDLSNADAVTVPVKVAVVDSGVDWQHPDLQSNFWVHSQGWGIDATTINSSLVNYNPFDVAPNGHGTHIAGLIGAVSNNSLGVVGTLPFNAKIMAIKIFRLNASTNELETNSTYLYNGLQFAILNGAEVMNLSLMATGSSYDAVFDAAIDDALSRGITVVGAMGNGSPGKLVTETSNRVVPAIFALRAGVMAVGSYDSGTDQKSEFSHYSPVYAEIAAPGAENGLGQGIFSTLPTAKGGYGRLAGTSQATAVVSGAAALAIAMIKRVGNPPTPGEVERLILQSARKNSGLSSYFKDGNQLDMTNLVNRIHTDYPMTKTDYTGSPDGC